MGNHNSGRRAKPTALKLLEGVRQDRINADEPVVPVALPPKPNLSPGAVPHWDALAPQLVALGILTNLDGVGALAQLCELLATRDQIVVRKSQKSFRLTIKDRGVEKENPVITMERRVAQQLPRYLAMFGMEPSSRSRLRVPKPTESKSIRDFVLKKGGRADGA